MKAQTSFLDQLLAPPLPAAPAVQDPGPVTLSKMAGKSGRKVASTLASHRAYGREITDGPTAAERASAYWSRWGAEPIRAGGAHG